MPGTANENRSSLRFFLSLLLGAFMAVVFVLAPLLLAVCMGSVLAVLLLPIRDALIRSRWRPTWVALALVLGFMLVVVIPLGAFLLAASKQAWALAQAVATSGYFLAGHSLPLGPLGKWLEGVVDVEKQTRELISTGISGMSSYLLRFVGNLPGVMLQVAIALMTAFFLLLDGERLFSWFRKRIPLANTVQVLILRTFQENSVSVVMASVLAALGQATVLLIAYLVLSVPGAFLAGGITFVFAWLPLLGCTPVWVMGAVYLYLKGQTQRMLLMTAFGLLASVVDNWIRPWVLQGRSELHPLLSLLVILGGLHTLGLPGIFLGPVFAALLISLLEIWPEVAS